LLGRELFLEQFSALTLKHFFKDYSPDKKLCMFNYWRDFNEILKSDFSFSYSPVVSNNFYRGVIRTYMKSIKIFMGVFLKKLKFFLKSRNIKFKVALRGFYGIYKAYSMVDYLSTLYLKPLCKPDYYFPGYRSVLRTTFFRCLSMFCMKIFVLVNKVFAEGSLKVKSSAGFFFL
jgi:hypothetical protein